MGGVSGADHERPFWRADFRPDAEDSRNDEGFEAEEKQDEVCARDEPLWYGGLKRGLLEVGRQGGSS